MYHIFHYTEFSQHSIKDWQGRLRLALETTKHLPSQRFYKLSHAFAVASSDLLVFGAWKNCLVFPDSSTITLPIKS